MYSAPLFTHQISHVWIDLRGIQDDYMRGEGIDYFENSRRATLAQQQYAIDNPAGFDSYDANCWGITASDGPGAVKRTIKGRERNFFDYIARGVPDGPADGTLAPWAVVASLPFAPEIVMPTLDHFEKLKVRANNLYGFKATFNTTFTRRGDLLHSWVSPFHYGLTQGPIVLMIESYGSGLLWHLMRECPYLVAGLGRADFQGGWLESRKCLLARRRPRVGPKASASGRGQATARIRRRYWRRGPTIDGVHMGYRTEPQGHNSQGNCTSASRRKF